MLSNIDNKFFDTDNVSKAPVFFKLDTFDGPIDLLLELIREKKMDILTLDIVELSLQYLEFVNANLNLLPIDEISEYLVIASYLTELKSKMIISMLNNQEIDIETELEIDRLRRQLFLYKQYKDIVNEFKTCQHQRVQYVAKTCDNLDEYIPDEMPDAPLPDKIDLDRLVRAWRKVLMESQNTQVDKTFTISVSNIDVDEIEKKLTIFITNNPISHLDFHEFIKAFNSKIDNLEYICAVFFALLSLSKNGIIILTQDDESGRIYISKNTDQIIDHVNDEINFAVEQQIQLAQAYKMELQENEIMTRKEIQANRKNNGKIEDSENVSDDVDDDELLSSKDEDIIDEYNFEKDFEED